MSQQKKNLASGLQHLERHSTVPKKLAIFILSTSQSLESQQDLEPTDCVWENPDSTLKTFETNGEINKTKTLKEPAKLQIIFFLDLRLAS